MNIRLKILLCAVGGLLLIWAIGYRLSRSTEPQFAELVVPQDPQDVAGLIRSAHQLWQATPGHYRPEDCAALLRRLSTSLDEGQFRAVSAAAFFAWINLRSTPEIRGELVGMNAPLLERFARTASAAELQSMVHVANQKGFDAAALEAALSGEAGRPVAPGEWDRSRVGLLSLASLEAEDFGRAKGYLQGIRWEEPAAPRDRESVTRLLEVVKLVEDGRRGAWDPAATVRSWQAFGSAGSVRASVRPILEKLAFQGLRPSAGAKQPGDFVRDTAKETGAPEFWPRVASRAYGWVLDGTTDNVAAFESLVHAIAAMPGQASFECLAWSRAAERARDRFPNDPGWPAKYYETALATAPGEPERVKAARDVADCRVRALEFALARRVIEETLATLKGEDSRKALGDALQEIRKKEGEDQARVSKVQKSIEVDRLRGQLDFMKQQLATARSQKKPAEDIQSLERIVKQLERQLTE